MYYLRFFKEEKRRRKFLQDQVDNAPSFVEVLHMVETWLNERNLFSSKLAFATDGYIE